MRRAVLIVAPVTLLAGCEGAQSALAPAGHEAEVLYHLWWIMAIGAAVVWLALNGTFFWFTRVRTGPMRRRWGEALILGGGVAFPTVGLLALLVYTLPIMAELRPVAGPVGVRVQGEQFWWRLSYETPDGVVETANELRLPAGSPTLLSLGADKVIHSFWVPSLAGKLDMFPGRETLLPLEPAAPGTWRGQCAELCGDSHALMAFAVVAMAPDDYAAWLAAEARPAAEPADERARRGQAVFMAEGCGACHTIRGTPAAGRYGPDLTHVGSRATIGAGTLANTQANMTDWIARAETIKPGVRMPSYPELGAEALADLAHYLEGLE